MGGSTTTRNTDKRVHSTHVTLNTQAKVGLSRSRSDVGQMVVQQEVRALPFGFPTDFRAPLGHNGGVNIAVWRMHSSRMSSTVRKSRFVGMGSVMKDTSINRRMREWSKKARQEGENAGQLLMFSREKQAATLRRGKLWRAQSMAGATAKDETGNCT